MTIGTPTSGHVQPEELNVDYTYQRPLEVTRFAPGGDLATFHAHAVGSVSVSRREDGTLWILDGQHRMERARRAGLARSPFPAQIYTGLTLEEEAALFDELNRFRNLHPIYRFKARVAKGEKTANVISDIVGQFGWRIGAGEKGTISAVAALEWVYDGGRIRREGQQTLALARTLEILTGAFGHDSRGVNASLIKGLGLVILRHGDAVETPKLVNEMGSVEGGANGLYAKAKALRGIRGGNLPHSVAEIIIELHNNRRRGDNKLPQWTR